MSEALAVGLVLLVVGVIIFAFGASDPFSLIQAGIGGFLAAVGALMLMAAAKRNG